MSLHAFNILVIGCSEKIVHECLFESEAVLSLHDSPPPVPKQETLVGVSLAVGPLFTVSGHVIISHLRLYPPTLRVSLQALVEFQRSLCLWSARLDIIFLTFVITGFIEK